jgi:N-acetylmuramoyl-L-alanine amidase
MPGAVPMLMMLFRLLLCTGLLLLPACTGLAQSRVRTVKLDGTTFLVARDVAAHHRLKYIPDGATAHLRSAAHTLRFTVDRREAHIDGVTLHLSTAAVAWRGLLLISETDYRLLVEPILRPAAVPPQGVRTIVIDPGHGGKDQGTQGQGHLEKDLVLRVATKLVNALRREGYIVHLTRTGDQTLTLDQRSAVLKRLKGDVFISLHVNNAAERTVQGIETFILPPVGTASTYGTRKSTTASAGNGYDKANARLAFDLQRGLLGATRANDRGVKRGNFAVLRDATCPAVLVELGFLSHAQEGKNLGYGSYQDKLVTGLVNGIKTYHRNVGRK